MVRASIDRHDPDAVQVADAPAHLVRFAEVLHRQSKESMQSVSRMVEALHVAQSLDDVITIQSAFFIRYAEDFETLTRQWEELLRSVPSIPAALGSGAAATTPLAKRFEVLANEAIDGLTEPVSGLSQKERRRVLFDIDR